MADVKITTALEGEQKVRAGLDSMTGHFKSAAKLIGTAFAGIGFTALIKDALDAGDEIQKLSIRIGASTEALSEYRHVADRAGVSFDTLVSGWQRMTRRIADAANGTGEAVSALDELGISAIKLKQLAPEDQFEALADAITSVIEPSDRLRIARKLFDAEGQILIQTMTGGSAAMREIREETRAWGNSLTEAQANGMADFNDALTDIKAQMMGVVNVIAVHMGPALTAIASVLGVVLPKSTKFFVDAIDGMRIMALHSVSAIAWSFAEFLELVGKLPGSVGQSARDASQYWRSIQTNVTELAHDYTIATMEVEEFKIEQGKASAELRLAAGETNNTSKAVREKAEADKDAAKKAAEYKAAMVLVREAEDENNKAKDRAIKAYKEWLEPAGMTIDANGEIVDITKKATVTIHDNTAAAKASGEAYLKQQAEVRDWGKVFTQTHHNVYESVKEVVSGIKGAWHNFFGAVIAEGGSFKSAVSGLWDDIKKTILRKLAEIVADAVWNQLASLITKNQSAVSSLASQVGSFFSGGSAAASGASGTAAASGASGAGAAAGSTQGSSALGTVGAAAGWLAIGAAALDYQTGETLDAAQSAFVGRIGATNEAIRGGAGKGTIQLTSRDVADSLRITPRATLVVANYSGRPMGLSLTAVGEGLDPAIVDQGFASASSRLGSHWADITAGLDEKKKWQLGHKIFNWTGWNNDTQVSGSAGDISDQIVNKTRAAMRARIPEFEKSENVDIPGYATGGNAVFSRPTLISVAEAGPEMITARPLASGREKAGGAMVFNGPVFFDELSMSRFERGLLRGMAREAERI